MEEKLNDALHQKQVLTMRLDSQLKLAQEDNRLEKIIICNKKNKEKVYFKP